MALQLPYQSCEIKQLIENMGGEYYANKITRGTINYTASTNKYSAGTDIIFTYGGKNWTIRSTAIPTNVGNTFYATIGVGADGKTFVTTSVEEQQWATLIGQLGALWATTTTTSASIKIPLYFRGIPLMDSYIREYQNNNVLSDFKMHEATSSGVVYDTTTKVYTLPTGKIFFYIGGESYICVNIGNTTYTGRHLMGNFDTRTKTFEVYSSTSNGSTIYKDMYNQTNKSSEGRITVPLFMDGIPQFSEGTFQLLSGQKVVWSSYVSGSPTIVDFALTRGNAEVSGNYDLFVGFYKHNTTDVTKFETTNIRRWRSVQYTVSSVTGFSSLDYNLSEITIGAYEKSYFSGVGRIRLFDVSSTNRDNMLVFKSHSADVPASGQWRDVDLTEKYGAEVNTTTIKGFYIRNTTLPKMSVQIKNQNKPILTWIGD